VLDVNGRLTPGVAGEFPWRSVDHGRYGPRSLRSPLAPALSTRPRGTHRRVYHHDSDVERRRGVLHRNIFRSALRLLSDRFDFPGGDSAVRPTQSGRVAGRLRWCGRLARLWWRLHRRFGARARGGGFACANAPAHLFRLHLCVVVEADSLHWLGEQADAHRARGAAQLQSGLEARNLPGKGGFERRQSRADFPAPVATTTWAAFNWWAASRDIPCIHAPLP